MSTCSSSELNSSIHTHLTRANSALALAKENRKVALENEEGFVVEKMTLAIYRLEDIVSNLTRIRHSAIMLPATSAMAH